MEVKSQRLLFSRCGVVASSNRDLDMKSIVGEYELDVIPRSLMTSDGSLHPGSDNKSDLIQQIANKYFTIFCSPEPEQIANRVAVIDAMVVVQMVIAHEKKMEKYRYSWILQMPFLVELTLWLKVFMRSELYLIFMNNSL